MDVIFEEQVKSYLGETPFEPVYQEEVAEVNLPESMPPIGQLVDCSGELCLYSKYIISGSIGVSGAVKASILYRAEETGELQKLEKVLPFQMKKEISGLESEHFVAFRGWIKRLDAKQLGAGKLLIRCNLGVSFTAYFPMKLSVHQPQAQPSTLQLLQNTYDLMLPLYCGEREFRISEEAVLPETAADIAEVLTYRMAYRITESKAVGDKAVFKGNLLLHLLYRAASGTLHAFDTELPFSQYIELDGEAEDSEVQLSVQTLSSDVETDGAESKRLLVSVSALGQAVVYAKQSVTLYEDAYVTQGTLKADWQELNVRARLDSQTISGTGELTVPATAEKVLDAAVYADYPLLRRDADRMKVIVPVTAHVIYSEKDGAVQGKEIKGELTYESAVAHSAICTVGSVLIDQPICLASFDTITVRVAVQLGVDCCMGSSMKSICSAQLEPPEQKQADRPSLIARRVGTESVWELAKAYGSTVSAICEANGLSNGTAREGAMLLIPMM